MPGRPTSAAGLGDDDFLLLLLAGFLGSGALLAAAVTRWDQAVRWLLDHRVLLPAAARPLLAAPGAHGAGLDLPRLAIAAAAVLLVIASAAGAVRQRWTTTRGELR